MPVPATCHDDHADQQADQLYGTQYRISMEIFAGEIEDSVSGNTACKSKFGVVEDQ